MVEDNDNEEEEVLQLFHKMNEDGKDYFHRVPRNATVADCLHNMRKLVRVGDDHTISSIPNEEAVLHCCEQIASHLVQ